MSDDARGVGRRSFLAGIGAISTLFATSGSASGRIISGPSTGHTPGRWLLFDSLHDETDFDILAEHDGWPFISVGFPVSSDDPVWTVVEGISASLKAVEQEPSDNRALLLLVVSPPIVNGEEDEYGILGTVTVYPEWFGLEPSGSAGTIKSRIETTWFGIRKQLLTTPKEPRTWEEWKAQNRELRSPWFYEADGGDADE